MDPVATARSLFVKLPLSMRNFLLFLLRIHTVRPVLGPLTYNQDGLATRHSVDFMKAPDFARAYEKGWKTGSWDNHTHWRVHVILWAAARGAGIEGDFVECGVNKGGFSLAVMEYLDFAHQDRTFWLLDTFCGLDDRYLTQREKAAGLSAGRYASCYEQAVRNFEPYPNARLVRGVVPETLDQVTSKKVAYLSLDMNCVEPEIAAARFFWDKMTSGAAMILDDYGWKKHAAQKEAFDAFAAEHGLPLLALPTGQGLILKP